MITVTSCILYFLIILATPDFSSSHKIRVLQPDSMDKRIIKTKSCKFVEQNFMKHGRKCFLRVEVDSTKVFMNIIAKIKFINVIRKLGKFLRFFVRPCWL